MNSSKLELLDFQSEWSNLVDRCFQDGYDSLNESEKVWYNVESLLAAINNGGFISYFYNSGADHVYDALKSLDAIGASETRKLLLRVMGLFPRGWVPLDLESRNKIINSWEDHNREIDRLLRDTDRAFFKGEEDVEGLLIQYIQEKGLDEEADQK